MHPGAFEACTDGHFASGFHHARGSAQALGVKLWVAHTFAVGLKIVQATARVPQAGYLASDGREQSLNFPVSSSSFRDPPTGKLLCRRDSYRAFPSSPQGAAGMKASSICTASGNRSAAMFQIHGAPSPSTPGRLGRSGDDAGPRVRRAGRKENARQRCLLPKRSLRPPSS